MKKIFFLSLFVFLYSCANADRPRYFPIYGKYCGKETIMASMLQQNPPEDVIDFLCSERLICIVRNGAQNVKNCDKIFIGELKKLDLQNPQEKNLVEAMIRFLN
jgi:hypothetical protein